MVFQRHRMWLLAVIMCGLPLSGCLSNNPASPGLGSLFGSDAPTAEPRSTPTPPSRGEIKLTIRPNPVAGPSALDLVLYEDGEAVGVRRIQISTRFINRKLGEPVRAQNSESTRGRIAEALAKRSEEFRVSFREALEHPEIKKYPTCETATVVTQRAGRKIWFAINKGKPNEEWFCYIVPKGNVPKIFGKPLGMVLISNAQITTLAYSDVGAHLVPNPNIGLTQTEDPGVLRPFYMGDVIKSSGALKEVGEFVNRSLPSTSLRRKVAVLTAMVQQIETMEIVRSSNGRRSLYPSAAAVLFDQRGPSDAKAVLLAALIQAVAPGTRVALIEVDDHYLLGVDVPMDARDRTATLRTFGSKAPQLVVADPNGSAPLGQYHDRTFAKVLGDGVITDNEADVVYSLTLFAGSKDTREGKSGTGV